MRYATSASWRMSLSASWVKTTRSVPAAGLPPRPERGAGACQIALVIAHLDLDAFFAAVEPHRNPGLRGKPVVVGGNPNGRGVVATARYEARRYGIRSAMSSAEARRRCAQVVFVRPDHETYREWSRGVWALVHQMAPVVERPHAARPLAVGLVVG